MLKFASRWEILSLVSVGLFTVILLLILVMLGFYK